MYIIYTYIHLQYGLVQIIIYDQCKHKKDSHINFYQTNMNAFGMLSSLSPEFKKKLTEVRGRAEKAETGTCNFLEINANPVTSLYLITGNKKDDGSNEKDIHMTFEQQPSDFPTMPNTNLACDKQGYKMYLTKVKNDYDLGMIERFAPIKFDEWKQMQYHLREIIDELIKMNHGIKCFEDGDTNNNDIRNVIFLHVCDVFNILMNKKRNKTTTLLIKTQLLKEIKPSMVDFLTSEILNETYMNYLVDNIDHMYTNYCYYGNGSFLPIRTHIAEDDPVFKNSRFFMNSIHYAKHQRGKLNYVNQTQKGTMNACVFRTF
jgi:hypothetical protein